MRTLTKEDKSELKCEVNIRLFCDDCDETKKRFDSLCKCLHLVHLAPSITSGKRYGPCLILSCDGDISLSDAELLLNKQDEYILPLDIIYKNGRFLLVNR